VWFCFPNPWAPWVPEKVINIKIGCPFWKPHLGNCDFLQFFDLEKVANYFRKNVFYALKKQAFPSFSEEQFQEMAKNLRKNKSDDHFVI
jgi:hypothetical protein